MEAFLFQATIYLGAAVIAVPLAARLGLGSVLGYLSAGIIIGPLFGLVGTEAKDIQHFAEFGVVMMLFLIGLELEPRALWDMRRRLIGLGGLQILLTTAGIMGASMLLGLDLRTALAVGLIFALSSTAIVLQTRLSEPHDTQAAFSLVEGLPGWGVTLVTLGAVVTIILVGVFLTRPVFRYIHHARLREMYTALALLMVTSIAVLMSMVGLSPALGTFLAGVVLANSEFRHELESDLAPFKGLLLGLFFITVGAGIDFELLADRPAFILGATAAIIAIKGVVLFGLSFLFKMKGKDRWLFTLSLDHRRHRTVRTNRQSFGALGWVFDCGDR